jgi:hypothetical protein
MNKLLNLVRNKIGCGYVWGSQGETLTPEQLQKFINNFGREHYFLPDGTKADKWIGKQCFDCSGLIVWAMNKLGLFNGDATAEDLYNNYCIPLKNFSDCKPGDLVFRKNGKGDIVHVGIYEGNGNTIEAKGTAAGVVRDRAIDFNLYGRLKFDLDSHSVMVQALLDRGAIKTPEYWDNNLVPGGTLKADYVIMVLKALGIPD